MAPPDEVSSPLPATRAELDEFSALDTDAQPRVFFEAGPHFFATVVAVVDLTHAVHSRLGCHVAKTTRPMVIY